MAQDGIPSGSTATAAAPAAPATPTVGADAPLVPFADWAPEGEATPPAAAKAADPPAGDKPADPPAAPAGDAPAAEPDKPAVDEPAADDADVDGEGNDPDADDGEGEGEEPAKPAEPAADVPAIEFLAEDSPEEFQSKVDQLFEAYDVDPTVKAVVDRYRSELETAQTQVQTLTTEQAETKPLIEAVLAVDDYVKDETTGEFVPNVKSLVTHLRANKGQPVFKRFAFEILNAPSEKFKHLGLSQLHEFFIDAGIPVDRISKAVAYFANEEELPVITADVPEGVPATLGEAYAKNGALRKVIEASMERLNWSEEDKKFYPDEYATAQKDFNEAVRALSAEQKSYDDDRASKIAAKQAVETKKVEFGNKVITGLQTIQKNEAVNFAKDLDSKLAVFIPDKGARALQVLTYQQLIVNALADDIYGDMTRSALKAQGIHLDFAKATACMQRIQDAVEKRESIVAQTGDEKLAGKAVETELTNALRDLNSLRKAAIGTVARKITQSYAVGADKLMIPAEGEGGKPIKGGDGKPQLRMAPKGRITNTTGVPAVNFKDPEAAGKYYHDTLFGGG